MRKVLEYLYKKVVAGGVMGVALVLCAGAALAFTEPSSGPSVSEPASADSTGQIETLLGTPQSATAGTGTVFGYLRTVYTNIGKTPSSVAPNASDAGKLVDLTGTSATAADGKTLFNFLKNINDNLDFPETSSVLSSDTVKSVSGSISNCSASNDTGQCYILEVAKSTLEVDLAAVNILSGKTIFGIAGSVTLPANCSSQGQQSCVATGSYYGYTRVDADSDGTYAITSGDCDDTCSTCYPGSTSYTLSPDGKDQDCDGTIDETHSIITIRLNYASPISCDTMCADYNESCLSVGTNSNADSTYMWGCVQNSADCAKFSGGSCSHVPGSMAYAANCGDSTDGYATSGWTRCRCGLTVYR